MERNKLNQNGVFLLDTFQVDYYGIPVIFQVCKTDVDKVAIYELATKEITQNGEKILVVTDKIRASDNPLLIPNCKNTYQKSDFWVKTNSAEEEPFLIFDISTNSILYYKAKLKGILFPKTNNIFAVKIENIKKYYWTNKERIIEA